MKKLLILVGIVLILIGCKPTLVTNYKVERKDISVTYYTDDIIQTQYDTLIFCEKYLNGTEQEYRIHLNDVRVFEKLDTRVAVRKTLTKNTYGKF